MLVQMAAIIVEFTPRSSRSLNAELGRVHRHDLEVQLVCKDFGECDVAAAVVFHKGLAAI